MSDANGTAAATAMATIYGMRDPREPSVTRYVGQTIHALKCRLDRHLRAKRTYHAARWVRSLLAKGVRPEIFPLEQVAVNDADAAEVRWIANLRANGHALTNCTDGGHGSRNASAETRAKLSRAMRGRPKTPEHRANMSAAHRRRQATLAAQRESHHA